MEFTAMQAGPQPTDTSELGATRGQRLQGRAAGQALTEIQQDMAQGLPVDPARVDELRRVDPAAAAAVDQEMNLTEFGRAERVGQQLLQADPAAAVEQGLQARDQIVQGPLAGDAGIMAVQQVADGQAPPAHILEDNRRTLLEQFGDGEGFKMFEGMSPWQHLLLWGGLSVGAIGLLNAINGEGNMGDWLTAILGVGVAAGTAAHHGLLGDTAQSIARQPFNPVSYLGVIPDAMVRRYIQNNPEMQQQLQLASMADRMGVQMVNEQLDGQFRASGISAEQQRRLLDMARGM